jgi:hypothetical protein
MEKAVSGSDARLFYELTLYERAGTPHEQSRFWKESRNGR